MEKTFLYNILKTKKTFDTASLNSLKTNLLFKGNTKNRFEMYNNKEYPTVFLNSNNNDIIFMSSDIFINNGIENLKSSVIEFESVKFTKEISRGEISIINLTDDKIDITSRAYTDLRELGYTNFFLNINNDINITPKLDIASTNNYFYNHNFTITKDVDASDRYKTKKLDLTNTGTNLINDKIVYSDDSTLFYTFGLTLQSNTESNIISDNEKSQIIVKDGKYKIISSDLIEDHTKSETQFLLFGDRNYDFEFVENADNEISFTFVNGNKIAISANEFIEVEEE